METENLEPFKKWNRKALLKKWIKALRSGEYRQVEGTLKKNDEEGPKYCCLGVLCDLATQKGYGKWALVEGDSDLYTGVEDFIKSSGGAVRGTPPGAFTNWLLGDKWTPDGYEADVKVDQLTRLNDRYKQPFDVIADFVEGKLTFEQAQTVKKEGTDDNGSR